VFDGNSVQASSGLLVSKLKAYSGYPEMFAGNGLFAGKYEKVALGSESTANCPRCPNIGVAILLTDPTAMTSAPVAGVEAKNKPDRNQNIMSLNQSMNIFLP
jgi:hypothetical protein